MRKLTDWLKDAWWPAPAAAVLAVIAIIISGIALTRDNGSGSDRFEFRSREVPSEFLYLDPPRVLSYLAQIQGGVSTSEETTSTRITESGFSIGAERGLAVEGQAKTQRQLFTRRVVTPTETSNYLRLLTGLTDPVLQDPVRFSSIDARSAPEDFVDQVTGLREGDFVAIEGARVLIPAYARPYDTITRLGSLTLLRGESGEPVNVATNGPVIRRLTRYAKSIGPNPRIILNLGARAAEDGPAYERKGISGCPADKSRWAKLKGWPQQEKPNARILVPIQYGFLADEFSLFSGGDSRVVGKVVRVLREPEAPMPRPRPTDVCFEDPAVLNTFGLGLQLLPDRTFVDSAIGPIDKDRVTRALGADTRAIAPAAVVVPVAIVKSSRDEPDTLSAPSGGG